MGVVARQSMRASILNYLGVIVGYFTVIWLFPLYLGAEQFGLTRILLSISAILSEFGRLGIPAVIVRYFPFYRSENRKHQGFIRFFLGVSTVGAIILVAILLLAKAAMVSMYSGADARLLDQFYLYLIPISVGMLYSEVLYSYSRSVWKAVVPSFTKELLVRLVQLVAIGLLAAEVIGFEVFLTLFAGSILIQPIILIAYLVFLRQFKLAATFKPQVEATSHRMVGYGLFMILNKMPGMAVNQLDVIMVGALIGFEEAAIYAVAFVIAELIRIPTRNLVQVANPAIANAWRIDNIQEIQSIYKKASLNLTIIASFLFVLIIANFSSIQFFLQPGYRDVFWVVFFVGVSKVFDAAAGLNVAILSTSKSYRYNLIITSFLLIITLITNLIFIPLYGIEGAAMATAISILINNSMSIGVLYWKYGIQPFSKGIMYTVAIAGMSGILALIIPDLGHWLWDGALNTVLVAIPFWAGVVMFGLHKELQLGRLRKWMNKVIAAIIGSRDG